MMKFRDFITAFILIMLLALLLGIVYARATWEGGALPQRNDVWCLVYPLFMSV